jgi:hypothetical protein
MTKRKKDNNYLQKNTQKTKDRATPQNSTKTGVNSGVPEG